MVASKAVALVPAYTFTLSPLPNTTLPSKTDSVEPTGTGADFIKWKLFDPLLIRTVMLSVDVLTFATTNPMITASPDTADCNVVGEPELFPTTVELLTNAILPQGYRVN